MLLIDCGELRCVHFEYLFNRLHVPDVVFDSNLGSVGTKYIIVVPQFTFVFIRIFCCVRLK